MSIKEEMRAQERKLEKSTSGLFEKLNIDYSRL